uniref:Uncharacterized protein n=1 Tax=Araucaria cunninghamii TaxID=56994 RepID=A0A0D6QUD4_ARACU
MLPPGMAQDVALQVVVLLVAVAVMWVMWFGVPRSVAQALKGGGPGRARVDARRHFVKGAQLLGRARASGGGGVGASKAMAREAEAEADRAIALDPADAACHILKALALERQGNSAAALASLDAALEPRVARSLGAWEKSDALLKRAELLLAEEDNSKKRRRRGAAAEVAAEADLKEAVELNGKNAKALCMLATCYEKKGMAVEARRAFQQALEAEPRFSEAKAGLDRLS